jgi:hypothetical protein
MLAASLMALSAWAAEPALIEGATSAPQFLEVAVINLKDKSVTIETIEHRSEFVTRDRTVIKDGLPMKVTETLVVQVPELRSQVTRFKQLRAVHPSGKEIPAEKLAAIKKGTVIVLSTEISGNIGQRFTKLLSEEAIVLLAERDPTPP